MGGLLSGLGELLGGWNTARRIDDEGFDFREKQAAQQFERDRQVEEARQKDEDRNVNIATDVLLGQQEGEPEPDISSLLPGAIAKFRARGAVARTKPALAAQAAALKSEGDLKKQRLVGEQRMQLLQEAEQIRASQQMSPREKEGHLSRIALGLRRLEQQASQFATAEAGRNTRWGNMPVQVSTGEYDQYGNPEISYTPRRDVLGTTAIKPNPTEFRARIEGELGREAMTTNLDTIQRQLDKVKEYSGTGAITSPMEAMNARETYKASIQNLAIAANRVLGDTSGRYSDVDRQVASAMLGIANDPLLIAYPEMAQTRLDEARQTIGAMSGVQTRLRPAPPRGGGGVSGPRAPQGSGAPIIQRNKRTGESRHSLDGGRTWVPGLPQ